MSNTRPMKQTTNVETGESVLVEMTEAEFAELQQHAPTPVISIPSITRHQCAKALFAQNLITSEESVAMAAWAEPPAMIERVLTRLPEPDQTNARIDFANVVYERNNPLLTSVMDAAGSTPAEIDAFFLVAVRA